MMIRTTVAFALLLLAAVSAHAADDLATYVRQPDPSYRWDVLRTGRFGSGDYIALMLTSQTWRGIPWKHQLFVFRPKNLDADSKQAFLYIDGGRWNPKYEEPQADLPRTAIVFAKLAEAARAPVVVVRQVPFQPIFDKREDALIAYTFDRYLDTGEADWPLLLPMVKSAVRGMDTVQIVAREQWHLDIERFTVAGASKRGWTSWLTTASDARVAAVAPMVIDMLNMPEQIRLQKATFGDLSDEIQDYEQIDLPGRVDSDNGRQLIKTVDPYSYRAQLTQPKLIVLATNDHYWPLDALSLYWQGLPQPKRVLYVPNQGHGVRDLGRVVGALSALHRYSERGEELPTLSWNFSSSARGLGLSVQSGRKPARVVAWRATSGSRDFREAHWSSHDCRKSGSGFACSEPWKKKPYTALYSEVTFKDRGDRPFSLSTAVCIVDATGAMVRPCLDNAPEGPVTSPTAQR